MMESQPYKNDTYGMHQFLTRSGPENKCREIHPGIFQAILPILKPFVLSSTVSDLDSSELEIEKGPSPHIFD